MWQNAGHIGHSTCSSGSDEIGYWDSWVLELQLDYSITKSQGTFKYMNYLRPIKGPFATDMGWLSEPCAIDLLTFTISFPGARRL